ncbi:uncharacterized protein LOC132706275 [Cylas formicarius]|uniref:uncharacterized protein LOC132706275 n=1 Tax=Cylas formicarius TaxID=197179 RepID=UPI0029583D47|nr:uncharacterized protein LOC132706275 [Cylas formicarius]
MDRLLPNNEIYLDEEIKAEYPTATVTPDKTSIDFRTHKNLRPFCYHCGDYNLSYGQKYFWHRCVSFRHFFCYYCFDYSLKKYTHTCVDGEPIVDECRTIEHLLCGKLKFCCKSPGCRKIFGGSAIKKHEITCEKQPEMACPVNGCKWRGRIDVMEGEHFKDHEDSKLILRNVVLKLDPGRKYYLLILGKFVLVDYTSEELGEVYEHSFSLSVRNGDVGTAVKPVGLVSTSHTLLKKIVGDDSVKSVRKNVVVFVYFE